MKYIIANWKSNKNLTQVKNWFSDFNDLRKKLNIEKNEIRDTKLVIAPSSSLLAEAGSQLENSGLNDLKLGVQDLSPFPAGSYTGAVSVQNLKGLGVEYVILGHSERRKYFKETHAEVARKVEQALDADIIPIICVDFDYIKEQAAVLRKDELKKCIVAYEPLAAIGTGKNVSLNDVKKAKKMVMQFFGDVGFIYGGSVNENNISEYLLATDGVLVGGASLDAKQFAHLVLAARGKV